MLLKILNPPKWGRDPPLYRKISKKLAFISLYMCMEMSISDQQLAQLANEYLEKGEKWPSAIISGLPAINVADQPSVVADRPH